MQRSVGRQAEQEAPDAQAPPRQGGEESSRAPGSGAPEDKTLKLTDNVAVHLLGYEGTESRLAFHDIGKMENGDEIFAADSEGREYTYEVFETLTAEPTELQVLDPIKGKSVIGLRACTLPEYSDRVVARGELVEL